MWKDEITKRSPEQRYYNNVDNLHRMIRDAEEFARRLEKSMKNNERYGLPLGRDSQGLPSHPLRTMEEVGSFLAKASDMLSRLI